MNMSNFEPSKTHLRQILLFCFNAKKSVAESQRWITEAYGDQAPSIQYCKYWFGRFKSGDFDMEDKGYRGEPEK